MGGGRPVLWGEGQEHQAPGIERNSFNFEVHCAKADTLTP